MYFTKNKIDCYWVDLLKSNIHIIELSIAKWIKTHENG